MLIISGLKTTGTQKEIKFIVHHVIAMTLIPWSVLQAHCEFQVILAWLMCPVLSIGTSTYIQ